MARRAVLESLRPPREIVKKIHRGRNTAMLIATNRASRLMAARWKPPSGMTALNPYEVEDILNTWKLRGRTLADAWVVSQ